ncbi:cytochrome P450 [Gymnopilus junonius]|uniref:Cytochrome P450 n=1 Tax=Gymnopilus junonius TaxID=109634 RepID=A0A9P5NSQ0_GYMJU|nr:cytochrome P450 [Gymnopilus junonius]
MLMPFVLWTAGLAIVFAASSLVRRRFITGVSVPKGPKGYPFIGNIFQIPCKDPFKTYSEWSRIYGPMVYMHVFGQEFVVLNSLESVIDLFEKRSSIYSTRPRLRSKVMAGELVERAQNSVIFMKYGPRWKACRKIMHGWMNHRVISQYNFLVERNAGHFLWKLLHCPGIFSHHIKVNAGSLILKLVYGIEPLPHGDPWIGMSEKLSKITGTVSEPTRWLVNSFPFLRYMPMWMPVVEMMDKGTAEPSWTLEFLQQDARTPKTLEEIATHQSAAGTLYAGGMVAYIRTFFLVMVLNPDVQKKAQAEIDAVVGSMRLPNMSDKPHLPYINCLIKEVFRINAIVPLLPHSLEQDDVYKGHHIPKGAWVIANMWAIFNDPSIYPEPERFNPQRFEARPGHPPEMDPSRYAFGIGMGRRFCPGYHLAMAFIFVNVTQILSTFSTSPELDKDGNEIIPPLKFDFGHLTSKPSDFNCIIKPRTPESSHLIDSLVEIDSEGFY